MSIEGGFMKAILLFITAGLFFSCAQLKEDGKNLQEFKNRFPQGQVIPIHPDRFDRTRGL